MPAQSRTGSTDSDNLMTTEEVVLHCGHAGLFAALDAAGIATWQWDADTDELACSSNIDAIIGLDGDLLRTGNRLLSLIDEADRNRVRQTLRLAWEQKGEFRLDFRLLRRNAPVRWLRLQGRFRPVRQGRGELYGIVADTTEAKQADEAKALLAAIVASSDDAIISKTIKGIISSWNAAAERLFGWTAEEVIGRPIQIVIPPELQAEEKEILSRLRRDEKIAHFETVRIAKDGRRLNVSLMVSPVRDELGRIIGASKVVRDITARKLAEAQGRERDAVLQTLGDNLPGALYQISRGPRGGDKRFTYVSAGIEALLGVTPEEVVVDPMNLYGLIFEEDLARVMEIEAQAERNLVPFDCVFRQRTRHGQMRWVHCKSAPRQLPDGSIAWDGIILDVTEQKRAEEALREADRRKDEFLAMLAHELRNPLAPIRNAVDFLELKSSGDADLRWAREIIDRRLAQLTRLVDDLLDVSRITRNKIALRSERVLLSTVLEQAIETSRPLIEAGAHLLQVSTPGRPLFVYGDRTRLSQVLSNLLNNAAKYTRPGGRIELTVEHAEGLVAIRVRDNGVGLSPEMLTAVFDLFTQADTSLERSQGGLGIGLTVARRLAEMHGGAIDARSEGPGKGSEFSLILPLVSAESLAADDNHELSQPARAHACKRILIVDDNRDSADTLASLLRAKGHDVRSAYSGDKGLEIAASHRPEVVLLDIGMPGMNGYDVARRLRDMEVTRRAIIVAMTGWGQPEDRRRSQEAGFDEHLVKPVDLRLIEPLLA